MSAANSMLDPAVIHEAVARALGEDVGPADITTLACDARDASTFGTIVTRQPCVVAGLPIAEAVFRMQDSGLKIRSVVSDGARVAAGEKLLELQGRAASILGAERVALNFLQQLSAIATRTREFVDAVAGTRAKILDTRKTAPGLRALQKYAVRCGGGENHRSGLYDAFLFKDNHWALLGSTEKMADAIRRARVLQPGALVEVEADSLDQVRFLATLPIDRILLDNMMADTIREAVQIIGGKIPIETSGGMTLERVRAVAETGVDYISVGELTHSVRAVDMSLEF